MKKNVPPSTQNQAFSALLYFWGDVLEQKLPEIDAGRAVPKERLPVVLSQAEVRRLFPVVAPEPYLPGVEDEGHIRRRYTAILPGPSDEIKWSKQTV